MSWAAEIHQKAAILMAQSELARQIGAEGDAAAKALLQKVGHLYEDEYPLAKAMDSSTLIVSVEGPAVENGSPGLRLLCALFGLILDETEKVARAITAERQLLVGTGEPAELALTATAPDHLYLGIGVRARAAVPPHQCYDGAKSALAAALAQIAQRCRALGPPTTEAEAAAESAVQAFASARIEGVTRLRLFGSADAAVGPGTHGDT